MDITLYNNTAEPIVVDKTNYLGTGLTLSGNLRESTALLSPSFLVESSSFLNFNYCYIPDFNRYYFIQSIELNSKNLYRLNLNIDVLMSFKDNIKNLSGIVSRNEHTYNKLLEDDRLSFEYGRSVDEEEIVPETSSTYPTFTEFSTSTDNGVCVMVTTVSSSGTTVLNNATHVSSVLPTVTPTNAGMVNGSRTVFTDVSHLATLLQNVYNSTSAGTFITNITLFPFRLFETSVDPTTSIYAGDTVIGGGWSPATQGNKYYINNRFQISHQATSLRFTDYEPYSEYELYIPYYGWYKLNANQVMDHYLQIIYTINYQDGSSFVSLIDETANALIFGSECHLGISIPFNTTNAEELSVARRSNTSNIISGTIANTLTLIGSIASGNPIGATGSVLSEANTITSYINNSMSQFERASYQVASGVSGAYSPQVARLRITRKVRREPTNYASLNGYPLNETKTLSTLTGYTEISQVHLENFSTATKEEIDLIETALKSGIIL